MGENGWRRRQWTAALLIASAVLAGTSICRAAPMQTAQAASPQAQDDTSSQDDTASQSDARAAAMRQVANACGADVVRLCPELGDDPGPHDTVICLRDYQVDLSLPCRSAIRAATQ